jgi:uncharacterized protein YqjF (DUF2071 family)
MGQTWEHVLFAHWPIAADVLRRVVPDTLAIDEFDGTAWIGVVAFVVRALRPRGLPPLPVGSCFAELNVRTYVTVAGRPGVHFLSLDAASRLAVLGARLTYHLPYFHARMRVSGVVERTRYESERLTPSPRPARLVAEYGPSGDVFNARAGDLDHFLIERYCLYTVDSRRRVHRADIHHPPWPLQRATAMFEINTMTHPLGVELPHGEPVLHVAAGQDVLIWAPKTQEP